MKIKLIKTILFRNHNGNDLRLTLGKIEDMEAYNRFMGFACNDDKGFRWQFVGANIPMPIRSYEWFNGFPEDIMANWVKSQGYEVVAVTSHMTGSVYVVKGNKIPASTGNDRLDNSYYQNFCAIIKELCANNRKVAAVRLYRYVHGGSLDEANSAVNAIRNIIH